VLRCARDAKWLGSFCLFRAKKPRRQPSPAQPARARKYYNNPKIALTV